MSDQNHAPVLPLLNVYCDESCHLLHDRQPVMAFGAVSAPQSRVREFSLGLKTLMTKHHSLGELKWGKVSASKLPFYMDVIEWFFEQPDLHFRALVVRDKAKLKHDQFNEGDHDQFYYKMYYYLLRPFLERQPPVRLKAYLDVKDTRGVFRTHKLTEVLANTFYDFDRKRVEKIQEVRSHESRLVQVADFLLGAVTYDARKLRTNPAKLAVVRRLKDVSGYDFSTSSEPWATKFNLFYWKPRKE